MVDEHEKSCRARGFVMGLKGKVPRITGEFSYGSDISYIVEGSLQEMFNSNENIKKPSNHKDLDKTFIEGYDFGLCKLFKTKGIEYEKNLLSSTGTLRVLISGYKGEHVPKEMNDKELKAYNIGTILRNIDLY